MGNWLTTLRRRRPDSPSPTAPQTQHSRSSSMKAEEEWSLEKKTNSRLSNHPDPGATAAGLLTDDLILEILSRLPARSVHRFKCVSVSWRDLIADPANRKKLPHTLSGFIYVTISNKAFRHHFADVSGDGAAPFDPFLPYLQCSQYKHILLVDACNGLLLCRHFTGKLATQADDGTRFVVCNPATGRWVELPPRPQTQTQHPASNPATVAGLAFDPAVSSHFHVLCFEQTSLAGLITGVRVYSSRTRAWSHRDSGMVESVSLFFRRQCVFVGGMMYVIGRLDHEHVLVGLDMEGKRRTTIRMPYSQRLGTIGSSQGCLHYAIPPADDIYKIMSSEIEVELWCLKDRDSKELVLKHTASIDKLMSMTGQKYAVVGMHPDCDTIFLVSHQHNTFVSYDIQHQEVGRILNLEKGNKQRFLPYVPLFSESLAVADADGQ